MTEYVNDSCSCDGVCCHKARVDLVVVMVYVVIKRGWIL